MFLIQWKCLNVFFIVIFLTKTAKQDQDQKDKTDKINDLFCGVVGAKLSLTDQLKLRSYFVDNPFQLQHLFDLEIEHQKQMMLTILLDKC